ncbi:hypothetical protein BCR39DRAFT_454166, partial [Naematelia encephala]
MSHTIGLLGHTGGIGKAIFSTLLPAVEEGKVKLVVFHRASSDVSNVPSTIEKREIDLENPDADKLAQQVKGIHTFISAVGIPAQTLQYPLIDALAKSSDLVTTMLAEFGFPWDKSDGANSLLPIPYLQAQIKAKALESGLALTEIKGGLFHDFFFGINFSGTDIKNNTVQVYNSSLSNPLQLASQAYIGTGTAQIALLPPAEIKGKDFYLYSHEFTGAEIVDVLAKVNGEKPKLIEITKEEIDKTVEGGGFPGIMAAGIRHWGNNDW